MKCIRVAINLPIRRTYTYFLPEDLPEREYTGYAVLVPFGNQRTTGFILGEEEKIDEGIEIKPILDILSEGPLFTKNMVRFFEWMSEYYFYPIGQIINSSIPSMLNVKRYLTAKITKKGERAIKELPEDSIQKKALLWIKENPGKRVELPIRMIEELKERGWISIRKVISKKKRWPLMRKFIRLKGEKINWDDLKEEEKRIISYLREMEEIPVFRLKNEIKNTYYFVRKLEKKGIIESFDAPVYKDLTGQVLGPIIVPERLEKQQEIALSRIVSSLKKGKFCTHLLFGVTGSGKTEVYIRAIGKAIEMGKQAIVLAPEISLAIYIESILRARLGERVAIYHSRLSEGERYEQWIRMAKGEIDVVVGARSALFSPLPRLGLIIVDEEHDPSYKQENIPYYQARDSAVMRGQIEDAVVVLGSATPSIQSYYNCIQGKYRLILMKKRVDERPMPEIEVVDMRKEHSKILSKKLLGAIEENLKKGNQTILFLNKRGFYRLYICLGCGHPVRCPNCDVSLVYHLREGRLRCHYCGYHKEVPKKCDNCGGMRFRAVGFGTERLENEISELFPDARISRMDADIVRKKGTVPRILREFAERKIDILIGTQMVTKGYHFPHVTLVGVIDADISLFFPDFRAAEWTYQLLSQVSGRAGRGKEKGKVIIQTHNPHHYSIQAAVRNDYPMLFKREEELRRALKYPPFSYMSCLRLQGNKRENVVLSAMNISELLRKTIEDEGLKDRIELLGPIEAPIQKIKGKFRWQIILKAERPYLHARILKKVESLIDKFLKPKGVSLILDVDPYYML